MRGLIKWETQEYPSSAFRERHSPPPPRAPLPNLASVFRCSPVWSWEGLEGC